MPTNSESTSAREAKLTLSVKNRHNERPGDFLPPRRDNADPESDDEKVRAMLRRVEAESMVASSGDVVEGELHNPITATWSKVEAAGVSSFDVLCVGPRRDPTLPMQGLLELTKFAEDDDVFDPNDVASDSD